jgi:putative oxidoreductase
MADQSAQNESSRTDVVGRSGVYPVSGPAPPAGAPIRGQGELAHPEERRRSVGATMRPHHVPLTVGRLLFGGYFLYNGINHFVQRAMLAQYASSKGVPSPDVAVLGSGVLLVAGGFSLLAGMRPKVGAALVATFLVGVTPRMHKFWTVEDETQRMQELVNFTKNLALLGAAALVAAIPEPWPGSLRLDGGAQTRALVRSHHQ